VFKKRLRFGQETPKINQENHQKFKALLTKQKNQDWMT